MFRVRYFAGPAVLALFITACGGASTSPTASQASIAPSAAARVVNLEIADGRIDPATVNVSQGETITFHITNANTEEVELIVGLASDVEADSGDSLKEAEHIAVGATADLTYTFDGAGPWAYGDQFNDHYAKGAHGDIVIQ